MRNIYKNNWITVGVKVLSICGTYLFIYFRNTLFRISEYEYDAKGNKNERIEIII